MNATKTNRKQPKRNLDNLATEKLARGILLIDPSPGEIKQLYAMVSQELEGLTPLRRVLEIFAHNPDTIKILGRKNRENETVEPVSVIAQLPLNKLGTAALFDGRLDTSLPNLEYISSCKEVPASIYVWVMHVTPFTAGGIALVMDVFKSPVYRNAPFYCSPVSDKARNFFADLGFIKVAGMGDNLRSDLMVFKRNKEIQQDVSSNVTQPMYECDRCSSHDNNIKISVVHSIGEFQKMIVVRSMTYMLEHDCPYDEEFDGNDFACTHILGSVDGEPAGSIRIRFFANFVKLERLAVIPRYRKTMIFGHLIRAAISLAQKKGYRKLYGHAEPYLIKLWARYGFIPRTDHASFAFSGRSYIEGDLFVDLINDPITEHSPAHVINRPEGQWHQPGVLDNLGN